MSDKPFQPCLDPEKKQISWQFYFFSQYSPLHYIFAFDSHTLYSLWGGDGNVYLFVTISRIHDENALKRMTRGEREQRRILFLLVARSLWAQLTGRRPNTQHRDGISCM